MRGSWAIVFLLAFTLALSSVPASASNPDIKILPEPVSVNSSLLLKVDPDTSETPIRITWAVYNTGNIGTGSLIMSEGDGICYFSNEDGNATCGPSPFFQEGATELYIYVVTPTTNFNDSVELNVSSLAIPIGPNNVARVDNTVFMHFSTEYDLMKYSIYREDLGIYQSNRALVYNVSEGRWSGNVTLPAGVYYFSFFANYSGSYGSALKRIEIPSGDFLNIDTDKDEYWIGEKIKITGKTNSDSVIGSVYYPDGKKAKEFTISVAGDQTFSYQFSAQSDWQEGEYEIKTTSPLVKNVEFSLKEPFEISPESVSGTANKSETFTTSVTVKNLRANSTNLTVSTTGGMEDSYVTLSDSSLDSGETAGITISISGVDSDIEGTIKLSTGDGLDVEIPVSITVSLAPGECPECPEVTGSKALSVDKDYVIWSQYCIAEQMVSTSVRLINSGDTDLSDFGYEVDDSYTGDQSLEDLDSYGYIEAATEEFSIEPGESEMIEITITPASPGNYQGLLTLKSGSESAFVFVDLRCYEDMESGITDLEERLAGLTLDEDLSSDIESDISEVKSYLSLENYQMAEKYYDRAETKIGLAESGGLPAPSGGGDFTLVLIIVVIIIAALVLVWFLKFKKPEISQYEKETEDLEGF